MLTDDQVQAILLSANYSQRRRKFRLRELELSYANKLRRKAESYLLQWCENGVPIKIWRNLRHSTIVADFKLVPSASAESKPVHTSTIDIFIKFVCYTLCAS